MKLKTINIYVKTYNNKYYKWYNQIISYARNRSINGYTEQHHIIPRALGGTDTPSNLVKLTAKEHLVVHMLLPRFVVENRTMWKALFCMMNMGEIKVTGRLYEHARLTNSAHGLSEEHKAKISAAHIGKKHTEEHRAKNAKAQIGNTNRRGKVLTQETRTKLSIAHTGKKLSSEHKAKISAKIKGIKRSIETRAKISAAKKLYFIKLRDQASHISLL